MMDFQKCKNGDLKDLCFRGNFLIQKGLEHKSGQILTGQTGLFESFLSLKD
jgi:hypothetical protein